MCHPHVERVPVHSDNRLAAGRAGLYCGGVAAGCLLWSAMVELPLVTRERVRALVSGKPFAAPSSYLGVEGARFFGGLAWGLASEAVCHYEVCKSCGRHTDTPGCTAVKHHGE